MTPEQYVMCLSILGLRHTTMPQALGVSWRQSYRYASGERPVPPALGIALALMVRYQLFVEQAQEIAETI
jgi:hypothetical protein